MTTNNDDVGMRPGEEGNHFSELPGAPQSEEGVHGKQQRRRSKGKHGPPGPFGDLWHSVIWPLLVDDQDAELQAAPFVDALMENYPDQFIGQNRDSLARDLQRYFQRHRKGDYLGPDRTEPDRPRSRGQKASTGTDEVRVEETRARNGCGLRIDVYVDDGVVDHPSRVSFSIEVNGPGSVHAETPPDEIHPVSVVVQDCAKGNRGKKRRSDRPRRSHFPGTEIQVDFTHCDVLRVTIDGEPYCHLFFQGKLMYSGFCYVDIASGETLAALMKGVQGFLQHLGGVTRRLRSDNATSAIYDGKPLPSYQTFLDHYGLDIVLIPKGHPWENGGVERGNGVIKTTIKQALLRRRSREFSSKEEYAAFVQKIVDRLNGRKKVQKKLRIERGHLRTLPPTLALEHNKRTAKVRDTSVIVVSGCTYSVDYRAIGEVVNVEQYADRLDVYLQTRGPNGLRENGRLVASSPRLHGEGKVSFQYRHVIDYLVMNPHLLEGWDDQLKEFLFPTEFFKETYARLREWDAEGPTKRFWSANNRYLRILYMASRPDMESKVDIALQRLLKRNAPFSHEDVLKLVSSECDNPDCLIPDQVRVLLF